MILSTAKKVLATSLTLLGVLPFLFSLFFFYINHNIFLTASQVQNLVASYAVIIAVFLSGAHWGQALLSARKDIWWLLIFSNMMTLLAWLGLFCLSFQALMFLMCMQFVLLLLVDIGLFKKSIIHLYYIILRISITILVVCSCFLLGWLT